MSNAARNRILLNIFLVMFIAFGIIITSSYMLFSKNIKKDEFVASEAAASFASIEINGDKAKKYVRTKETDGDYQIVLRHLMEYVHDSRVNRIRVVSYTSTVAYNIFDTGGTELAQKIACDDYETEMKTKLVECRESWNATRGNTNYTYRPVRTSDDVSVGYIITESSVVNSNIVSLMLMVSAGAAVLILAACWIVAEKLRRDILMPVETFKLTADQISKKKPDEAINSELLNRFDNGSTYLFGGLGKSIRRMVEAVGVAKDDVDKAIYEATHDVMTGVFNKRHYENKVENYSKCSSLLVIYFDVNNLKLMNDTLGHERGDYVIEQAAEYIKNLSASREKDVEFDCFRMGGDEFLLVVRNRSYREMISIVNKLDEDCPVIVSAETDSVKCSVAYGYAYAKGSYVYEQLLAEAEDNMYRKKYEIKQQLNMPDR
ncbi:GGDEF domain-containing protein [Ruminococcus sp. HUN007]|uniref:GGDEF domain-containing protein n=1 Tax=Ruminococcus sp. HUN007 TaxID=1514668 RepID=UPI0005D1F561|nr:GGDEF domain-containing protein [Ruminococcus sp. HUN007]